MQVRHNLAWFLHRFTNDAFLHRICAVRSRRCKSDANALLICIDFWTTQIFDANCLVSCSVEIIILLSNEILVMDRYPREIPDAYERLLLDAIEGERRLFIRSDELDAAWDLFTPVLKELEEKKIVPELYPYGSRGPVGAHYLASKYNVRWGDLGDQAL